MYGILIDPDKQEVREVEFDGKLDSFYKLLECDLIDRVAYDDHNDIVLDDEGLYKGHESFFSVEGVEGHYVGKAIIVGVDEKEGEWVSPINISHVRVKFYVKKKKIEDETSEL